MPDVHVVVEQRGIVGAGIQHDRDDAARVQPGRRDVHGELPDRDLDAADPPVPDAQDPLRIRGNDQVDLVGSEPVITKRGLDLVGMIHRQVDPARAAVLVAVPLDRRPDRRGVDDRQHLLDVVDQQPVEQDLVAVAQVGQVQVLGQVVGLAQVLRVHPGQLAVDRRDAVGQQAGQAQLGPLGHGERGPAVEQRRRQDGGAAQADPGHHPAGLRGEFIGPIHSYHLPWAADDWSAEGGRVTRRMLHKYAARRGRITSLPGGLIVSGGCGQAACGTAGGSAR